MARPKVKVSEARSFRIRKDLGTRLDDYSEWSHIPKTVIVELALEDYQNKYAYATKNTTLPDEPDTNVLTDMMRDIDADILTKERDLREAEAPDEEKI